MALSTNSLRLVYLLCFYQVSLPEKLGGSLPNFEFDFDALPGTQHEFKVDVKAGKEECFVQKVAQGANLYVQFEVLRGGDRSINVVLIDPHYQIIQHLPYQTDGKIDHVAVMYGAYQLCFDNTASRFAGKLVYIYIVTYVTEEWTKYLEEIQSVSASVNNFTGALAGVQTSIEQMKLHQTESRMHVIKDWYLVTGNNKYVMYWSIFQMCVVLFTGVFQVFCLRRLFRVQSVTPTSKPRA
ncbi:transmembrane emp24 domain-containing protein 6-like [Saccostrea echinata]|uniref:transmembrane emp24 domain-containing protein 6-like n=1 Tax=Saccostrea echinata TaxID=191078 RepID=UPI002A801074|nr:transmembrane emp24 domain-containing protein 6-like [Saccostrea echinata]